MLLSIPHSLGPSYQLDPGSIHPSIRVNPDECNNRQAYNLSGSYLRDPSVYKRVFQYRFGGASAVWYDMSGMLYIKQRWSSKYRILKH